MIIHSKANNSHQLLIINHQLSIINYQLSTNMSKPNNDTPLMQQHQAIKEKYPDAILLFRVGDFYETFGEDAVKTSQALGITLTKRNNGSASSLELAGFPHHALDTYLHKLVKAGYRVAICDQLEDPKQAKGIVKRGVTEMVTPGTTTNDKLLEHHSNNFLAGIHMNGDVWGAAFLDLSIGEFLVAEGSPEYIDKLVQSLKPSEIVYQRQFQKIFKETFGQKFYTYTLESWIFDEKYATESLLKHFQTHSLKGFGIDQLAAAIIAAGAVLQYVKDTEHPHLQHITSVQRIDREDHLWMDKFTIRNLELISNDPEKHTLLQVLDHTVSPMGARLLKRWMVLPLNNLQQIQQRLDLVAFFVEQAELRKQVQHQIKLCGDVERLVSKLPLKKINPREVLHLAKSLQHIAQIKTLTQNVTSVSPSQVEDTCKAKAINYLSRLSETLNSCEQIAETIVTYIEDNPPIQITKGGTIRTGVHKDLDEFKHIATSGKAYLIELQQKEMEATGINSLKVGFNNVFGYYLEVTNAHKNKVPDTWIRKQTLTSAERYITPELKTYEEKIIGAEEKIIQLETQLFDQLLLQLQDYIPPIQTNGQTLATIDVLLCFAEVAIQYKYKKPEMHSGIELQITAGRHPVIEQYLPAGEKYIDNDIHLDITTQQIIILTGPNMSGKSALLRQTALITLMAHMGSFVSATSAHIPLTDKIFVRVGASDNLSAGESTFMVEMNETASILHNATNKSLVLLDEIGRGTSTYDGISIAWSMVEHLHNSPQRPKTLFATHYHELNDIEQSLANVKNFHITHKEIGNKIIFLRKMEAGGSTHSFGIQVARMVGMPLALITRAEEILKQLEAKAIQTPAQKIKTATTNQWQLSIFDTHTEAFQRIRTLLHSLDINRLTPVEALLKLNEIKEILK